MARIAVEEGISITACTPHITPGVYDNRGPQIKAAITALQAELDGAGIPLMLVAGADVHVSPGLVKDLRDGTALSLHGSRYVLIEPPHHIMPPRLEEWIFNLMTCGYVPVITHPERLSWIDSQYSTLQRLAKAGAWMQLTAGSITGHFGKKPLYWAERLIDDGLFHIMASDAHNTERRSPRLRPAYERVALRLGAEEAQNVVWTRPAAILHNRAPTEVPLPPGRATKSAEPFWRKALKRLGRR